MSKINFNSHFLKNPAVLLVNNISAPNSRNRILPDMLFWFVVCGEISITMLVFILRYFQEKPVTKFSKNQKLYFGVLLGNFCPTLEKNEFSWKKCSASF